MSQRNFTSQMHAIQSLSETTRFEVGRYEITEFQVEEWAGNRVHVLRLRCPLDPATGKLMREGFGYHESFVIGPRGKRETLYSSLY